MCSKKRNFGTLEEKMENHEDTDVLKPLEKERNEEG